MFRTVSARHAAGASASPAHQRPRAILTVVNYRLPNTDYRLQFALRNPSVRVVFGLPERPALVSEDDYIRLRFGEGVRPVELLEFLRLFLYIRRHRTTIDLVHLFSTKLALFGPFVVALAGGRSITTVTGFGRVFNDSHRWWRPVRPLYLFVLFLACRCSETVLYQNHGDMAWMLSKYPSLAGKARYVGSAVKLDVTPQAAFTTEPLTVLLVSRLVPSKGVEDFLDVASELYSEGFRFVLVGPPSADYRRLEARVKRAAVQGQIVYAGVQKGDDLKAIYESAHIFLFPSYGEGMARVMLEAGFAGLCPVAYDINANRDLVHDGNGFLVPPGKTDELIAYLRKLRGDRDMLAAAARNYLDRVQTLYSVDAYESRFMKVLEETHGSR